MQFLLLLNRKKIIICSITVIMCFTVQANSVILRKNFFWSEHRNYPVRGVNYDFYQTFDGAYQNEQTKWLPYFKDAIRLGIRAEDINIKIRNLVTSDNISNKIQQTKALQLLQEFDIQTTIGLEQGNSLIVLQFLPLAGNYASGIVKQIISCEIEITYKTVQPTISLGKKAFASNSALANGQWYKIAVVNTGFHKLDAALFNNNGIPTANIDPRSIRIYSYGAGVLPQPNSVTRPDDMLEHAILVQGESDGSFNDNDYVMFFGKSQFDVWKQNGNQLVREKNIYSDTTYYFLTFNQGLGKRITTSTAQPAIDVLETKHYYCYSYERELVNPGKSGKVFLGETFDRQNPRQFSVNIVGNTGVDTFRIRSSVAARANISPASFVVSINNVNIITHNNMPVLGTYYGAPYYAPSESSALFPATSGNLNVSYRFNQTPGGSIGWLDFFELTGKAKITWYNNQVLYRVLAANNQIVGYDIEGAPNGIRMFNVTNQSDVKELPVTVANNLSRVINQASGLNELAGFFGFNSLINPIMIGRIANQDLHGLPLADGIYIAPGEFYQEAQRLAQFHAERGLKIHVVTTHQIYNEFGSGCADVTAIRDFIRMFYNKTTVNADRLKFVTLFGRASYDYKGRIANNSNFVPTYQSNFSNLAESYCSDDYIALLDDNEGRWDEVSSGSEFMEIGVGRLPVSNNIELKQVIDKIISYHSSEALADWRNRLVFVSDDDDQNLHQNQANKMANNISNNFKQYNAQKIFIDAFKEEILAGGERYPNAQRAINDAVQKGSLILNYTGHGGELGWAAERILTIENINSWTNANRLSLFVTATCEFSRFDDPERVSAGELTFLNPNGGTIGLLTTVRLVYVDANDRLNDAFYRSVGLESAKRASTVSFGEMMRLTKSLTQMSVNDRSFTLLGDAAMHLAIPRYNVTTTAINGKPITTITDTLKALSKVTVEGRVEDMNGQLMNNFNGLVYPTVFDKPSTYRTLVNNPGSAPSLTFQMQDNIIYSGSATVKNGIFSFSFIVPKDISYQFGKGKISYYAENQTIDGNGFNEDFLIGGTADSINRDAVGPDVRLFINDESFVYGGITSPSPLFIARLFDINGINTVGKGIGRELVLILDNDQSQSIPMSNYYRAKTDSYQEGEVRYQLSNLSPGKHTLTLRAWDTHNNPTESTIEFTVINNDQLSLKNVLNYPNPFVNATTFHFDHNAAGEDMTVMIQIYTVSGQLIKTLSTETIAMESHFDDIFWDGRDDFGDKLANGVYIYKVKVKSRSGKTDEVTQKLVILN